MLLYQYDNLSTFKAENMQEQFTYRELSEKLDINLAKLKRWGREFLPPDPVAGQSQGVARILTIDEAFILFLSGHLVAKVNFSIPIAKIIMEMLVPYLKEKKLLPSVLSLKELATNERTIKISTLKGWEKPFLMIETIVKMIEYKTDEVSYKDFKIHRKRIEEHKIIEDVFMHDPPANKQIIIENPFSPKTFYFDAVMLAFLAGIRGKEVYHEWGRLKTSGPEFFVFPDDTE
jgi:hypothetical protein